jgi:GTP cyclohydrolase I
VSEPGDDSLVTDIANVLKYVTGNKFEAPHMKATPRRWASMMEILTSPVEFEFTTFEDDHQEMVLVADIPFFSLCAHHLIPFFGKAHVAYIPNGKLVGLSKIPRTVKYFSSSLQVQETLTSQVADFLDAQLAPRGVAVVMKGEHLCMAMRGVQVPGTQTTTSAMRGVFLDNDNTARAEFLALIPCT